MIPFYLFPSRIRLNRIFPAHPQLLQTTREKQRTSKRGEREREREEDQGESDKKRKHPVKDG